MKTLPKTIAAATLIFLLCTPAFTGSLEEQLQRSGLDVAYVDDARPLCFPDLNGEPQGLIVDFWKAWSKKAGIPVRFALSSWQEAMQSVLDGRTDVLGGMVRNAERERRFDLSKPVLKVETVLIAKAGSGHDEKFFAQEGVVGVIKATQGEKLHSEFRPGGKAKAYIDADSLLKAFSEGEVDGMITYLPSFAMPNSRLERPIPHEIVAVLDKSDICIAARKGDKALFEVVAKYLSRISDREREAILGRWFIQEPARDATGSARLRILGILLVAGIAVMIFRITRHPKR